MDHQPNAICGLTLPDSAEVLAANPGSPLGNVVLRLPDGASTRILKIYRRRKGRLRDLLNRVSHRAFESKRGSSARDRCETERRALEIWNENQFPAPRLIQADPPPWAEGHPSLWMEDLQGPTLRGLLADPQVSAATKRERLAHIAGEYCERHRRAIASKRPILAQEHPSAKHVIVCGDRLVTFDLEHAYAPGYPALDAVVHELATWLRSLLISPGYDDALPNFVQAYPDRVLLDQLRARFFASGFIAALRRRSDERRRKGSGKVGAMKAIEGVLASP